MESDGLGAAAMTGALMAFLFMVIGAIWYRRRQPWTSVPIAGAVGALVVPAITESFMPRMLANNEAWMLVVVGLAFGSVIGAIIWQYRKDGCRSLFGWMNTPDEGEMPPAIESVVLHEYVVVGVDTHTGGDVRQIIQAASEANARIKAERHGITVTELYQGTAPH